VPSRRSTPPSRGAPSPATIARRLYGAYFDRLTDEEKVNAAIADFGDAHAAERAFTTTHLSYLNVVQAGRVADASARTAALLEAVLDRQERILDELRAVSGQLRGLQVASRRRVRPQRAPEVRREELEEPDLDFDLPEHLEEGPVGDVDGDDGITLVDENGQEIEVVES
jgi:hypothetical protein